MLAAPYKPPGIILASNEYWMKPVLMDDDTDYDFLRLIIHVKELELISEKGEIIINGATLDTRRPIQLVEGQNIIFGVNTLTNQITIDTRTQGDPGLVGTKAVDETTIGHGKVLSYDNTTHKLIYIDISQTIEDIVNEVLERVVDNAVNEAVTNVVNNILPHIVDDKVNNVVPQAVSNKVEEFVPNVVERVVNEVVPIEVNNTINDILPNAITNEVNIKLPTMVNQEVNNQINVVLPNEVTNKINDLVPNFIDQKIDEIPKTNFIDKEIPSGNVDGVNKTFELSYNPDENSEKVYINGVLLVNENNEDYEIQDNILIFNESVPEGVNITVSYRYTI